MFVVRKIAGTGIHPGSAFTPFIDAFIEGLVQDYFAARKPSVSHDRLSRGTARSVSGVTEERLAAMLADTFPQIEHVYVDQELLVPGRPKRKPDLAVVMGSEIRLMVDVKMDLGRNREGLPIHAARAAQLIEDLAPLKTGLSVNARTDAGRISKQLAIAKHCEYVFVIVSGRNISQALLHSALFDPVTPVPKWARVHRLVLWPTVHPNDPEFITPLAAAEALKATLRADAVQALEDVCNRTLQP